MQTKQEKIKEQIQNEWQEAKQHKTKTILKLTANAVGAFALMTLIFISLSSAQVCTWKEWNKEEITTTYLHFFRTTYGKDIFIGTTGWKETTKPITLNENNILLDYMYCKWTTDTTKPVQHPNTSIITEQNNLLKEKWKPQ